MNKEELQLIREVLVDAEDGGRFDTCTWCEGSHSIRINAILHESECKLASALNIVQQHLERHDHSTTS